MLVCGCGQLSSLRGRLKRGKKVLLIHKSTLFFCYFFFLLDQVLKCRVKVSLHGAWTESQCAGKARKQLFFSSPNKINHVSWFCTCLDCEVLCGFGIFFFLKAWLMGNWEINHSYSSLVLS